MKLLKHSCDNLQVLLTVNVREHVFTNCSITGMNSWCVINLINNTSLKLFIKYKITIKYQDYTNVFKGYSNFNMIMNW